MTWKKIPNSIHKMIKKICFKKNYRLALIFISEMKIRIKIRIREIG
jgi:hypothetical protein